jgi:hypothetical protein
MRGRLPTTLATAISRGINMRPMQARGDYISRGSHYRFGSSVLMAAAEGASGDTADHRWPARTLDVLKKFPILARLAVCPVCDTPARMDEILELHLNDEHGWPRARIAAWVREIERAAWKEKWGARKKGESAA